MKLSVKGQQLIRRTVMKMQTPRKERKRKAAPQKQRRSPKRNLEGAALSRENRETRIIVYLWFVNISVTHQQDEDESCLL